MCGKGWRCAHKAAHSQGGAHTRWSVATARILLFKGFWGLVPASSEASCLFCLPKYTVGGLALPRGTGAGVGANEAQGGGGGGGVGPHGGGGVGANEAHGAGEFGANEGHGGVVVFGANEGMGGWGGLAQGLGGWL